MSKIPDLVANYWDGVFESGSVLVSSDTFTLRVNADVDERRSVMMLDDEEGRVRATLTPRLAHHIGLSRYFDGSASRFRALLGHAKVVLHDPDLLFYAPETKTAAPTHRTSRRLTYQDRDAFASFQARASEEDLDAASVDVDHWLACGAFEHDRLVSVASMYPWDNSGIADLGVLTLPDARGKGYAAAVVQEIGRLARARGYEPQYRCQIDNEASIALAQRLGLVPFGRWEVVAS